MRSITTAGLGACTVLAALVACSSNDITRSISPNFRPGFDVLAGGCPGDYHLAQYPNSSLDRNGDGFICERTMYFETTKKTLLIDNSVGVRGTCPANFPTPVNTAHAMGLDDLDQNANYIVCQNLAGDLYTDDNR
jgi:hypothetical protein